MAPALKVPSFDGPANEVRQTEQGVYIGQRVYLVRLYTGRKQVKARAATDIDRYVDA